MDVEFCQRLFIFQFVNVVYYIDWYADIEESLHPWDKAHLVMVYDLFNVLLDKSSWQTISQTHQETKGEKSDQ